MRIRVFLCALFCVWLFLFVFLVSRAAPASRQQKICIVCLLAQHAPSIRRAASTPADDVRQRTRWRSGGRMGPRAATPSLSFLICLLVSLKMGRGRGGAQNKETFPVCYCCYRSLLLIFVQLVVPAIVVVIVSVDNSPNF